MSWPCVITLRSLCWYGALFFILLWRAAYKSGTSADTVISTWVQHQNWPESSWAGIMAAVWPAGTAKSIKQQAGRVREACPTQSCVRALVLPHSHSTCSSHAGYHPLYQGMGAKFDFRDLWNVPPDALSALPFLCALWSLPSAENVCLGADTFAFTCLHAFPIKPILEHPILLSSPFFDYTSLMMTVSPCFLSAVTRHYKV